MSVVGFVRAAGGVMGAARDGFGVGALGFGSRAPMGPPPSAGVPGAGAAVSAHDGGGHRLAGVVGELGARDAAGDAQLGAALAGSEAGRARMGAVIAAAIGDVEALGLAVDTAAGQKALVEAIGRRLAETKEAVGAGSVDAGTQAASADASAAGYHGLGGQGAPGLLGAGMPPMGGMPMMPPMGGGGLPGMGGGLPMLPLSALQGLQGLSHLATTAGGDRAAGGPVAAGDESVPGKASERGLQRYTKLINRAVSAAFPEITDIGGVRADALKWHPQGLALDVMIPHWDTPAGKALGDRVVSFLIANKDRLGVDHMIWRQHMVRPDGHSSLMEDRGSSTQNHMNHVHVASIGGGF